MTSLLSIQVASVYTTRPRSSSSQPGQHSSIMKSKQTARGVCAWVEGHVFPCRGHGAGIHICEYISNTTFKHNIQTRTIFVAYNNIVFIYCMELFSSIIDAEASFQLFLGGQILFLFFNATGLLKNWRKKNTLYKVNSNLTLFVVQFFFFFFFLFFHFFLFPWGAEYLSCLSPAQYSNTSGRNGLANMSLIWNLPILPFQIALAFHAYNSNYTMPLRSSQLSSYYISQQTRET